ncbi:MAG: hypothetical protein J1F28_09055 [Oscillospiraceae bacterium]|nr:hypothetical protein [Oscillospiraceae bacterium]
MSFQGAESKIAFSCHKPAHKIPWARSKARGEASGVSEDGYCRKCKMLFRRKAETVREIGYQRDTSCKPSGTAASFRLTVLIG